MKIARLTKKQEAFCREYMIDLNATQAAIRAGYSKKTANVTGYQTLVNPSIQERITELLNERNIKLNIDAGYVLKRHIQVDEMDVIDIIDDEGNFRRLKDWPKVWRQFITAIDMSVVRTLSSAEDQDKIVSVLKKIKWPDKLKNLELLGKHVNVQAYSKNITFDNDKLSSQLDELISSKPD